ncbi:calmodulin-regulated spectrin-associated protein 1-like [Branchiostoma floridae x Branchiostoma belcheri]
MSEPLQDRRTDADDGLAVPDILPLTEYDSFRGKVHASLLWAIGKAYGGLVPPELQWPFFTDDEGTEQLTPLLVGMLTAGELYCMICTQLFREPCDWGGHWSVIQALGRRGIQAMEDEENGVSQENLQEAQPINLKSHLAVLDALMEAYINEVISIEGVVTAVKKFASFNASQELPYDMEDALLFWLSKVGRTLQDDRASKKVNDPEGSDLPVLDDILKDLNDGRVLLAVLCFYCPNHIHPAG